MIKIAEFGFATAVSEDDIIREKSVANLSLH